MRTPRVLITSLIPTGTPASGGKRLAFGGHAIHAVRLLQRALFRQRQERADLAVFFLNARVVRLGQRERGRLALLHGGAGGIDRE